ncbi:beta-lactamase family protein [Pseudonocardia sp. EV170527-09]|uniref:serine hydrolase domain-containing protein n=1 Tax=Pseudonocardia sp. EV170527-09 TaxID=2603411 RepID=UPI0011F0D346|nr:serine hydrolase domain-containing protein [Pseudonocardia sp. EV170527-09]KAA1024960.1 beta-lactamase family protein [Pseudonocardia sp. EV170527-09]
MITVRRTGGPPRRSAATVALLVILVAALVGRCAAPAAPASDPAPRTAVPTAPLTATDVGAWLDGLVPAALDRSGIAGAAVTVVRDGQVLAARGYGSAGPGRPVDPARTLFRVGSVSKVATAVAVLQLADRGLVDLDADVRRHLDIDVPMPRGPVTLRNLLSHTAGFEEQIRGLIRNGPGGPSLREFLATDPPEQVSAPGTVPSYSNYGYGLVGHVVERVTGEPFERYVQREVLDRAGMTTATFDQPLPAAAAAAMSDGHTSVDAPPMPFEFVSPAPAGSLSASATDMGRFASALLGAPGSTPLLSPAAWALMQRPALGPDTLGALADGPRMALGLFDESRNGHLVLGHGGDTQWFHSHLQLYPAERIGVFVTTNSSGRGGADTLELRRAVTEGFTDRYLPGPAGPASAPDAGTPARAAAIAGTYESARRSESTFMGAMNLLAQMRVAARPDGTLLVSPAPNDVRPAAYAEVRPGLWREVGGQRLLTVRTDADGRVTALGHDAAFTELPVGPLRDATLLGTVLAGSVVVLLGALVARPAGALWRRRYGVVVATRPRADRVAHGLTRAAALAALVALTGWVVSVLTIASLGDVPLPVLRGLQVLQWIGVVGVPVAAAGVVTALRARAGGWPVTGRVMLLLALAGIAVVAVVAGLLLPSLTY